MKKVLIDANPIVPIISTNHVNGIGRTCMELILALDKFREDIPFSIELYTQNLRGVSAKRLHTGFKCHHVFLRNNNYCRELAHSLHIRELVSRYDLQHITHNFELVTDPSRCVLTIHDAMFFSYPEAIVNPEHNQKCIPALAKKAAHIITISECSKNDIMKYMDIPEEKISVIPWGTDFNLFHPHKTEQNQWCGDKPFFASVSCDRGRKNTISVLQAYEKFAANNPEHHLILVWRDPSAEARELAESPLLKGRVHFAQNISNEELADIYAGATASFFPSLYEGFGLPILESMASGTPCVTAMNSSLGEVGGDAAIYTAPTDIDAIANEMEKFENGAYDMNALQNRSLERASKFTWERCAQQTLNVYKTLLG